MARLRTSRFLGWKSGIFCVSICREIVVLGHVADRAPACANAPFPFGAHALTTIMSAARTLLGLQIAKARKLSSEYAEADAHAVARCQRSAGVDGSFAATVTLSCQPHHVWHAATTVPTMPGMSCCPCSDFVYYTTVAAIVNFHTDKRPEGISFCATLPHNGRCSIVTTAQSDCIVRSSLVLPVLLTWQPTQQFAGWHKAPTIQNR